MSILRHHQTWRVQYKYGDSWQHHFLVGDSIKWGGNDKGKNVGGHVRTDCIAENNCDSCKKEDIEGWVYFNDNIISKIELVKTETSLESYYEVIDP